MGNWLCRRVRMDIAEAEGGTDEASCGPGAALFLDWLKRRSRDVLRTGRESAALADGGPVFPRVAGLVPSGLPNCCGCEGAGIDAVASGIEDESGGLGK